MPSGVYQILNRINGKRYIGSTINIKRRWQGHLNRLRYGQHGNQHLQQAFDKHGENTFVFSVLEYTETQMLVEREQHYLNVYLPEYNISPMAGSPLGVRHGAEVRRRMSKAHIGHPVSAETRHKISDALTGRSLSLETCRKLSEALTGRRLSKEHKQKIRDAWTAERRHRQSEALRGKPRSMEVRKKISASHKGKHPSEETRRKLSEAHRGKPLSEEHRAAISAGQKARYRRLRQEREE